MTFTPPAIPEGLLAQIGAAGTENPDVLIALRETLEQSIQVAEFPAMTVEMVDDDGEEYTALRCPRCQAVESTSYGLMAVDISERWTHGDETLDEERHMVSFSYEGSDDYHGSHYRCSSCYGPVSLPEGWEERS